MDIKLKTNKSRIHHHQNVEVVQSVNVEAQLEEHNTLIQMKMVMQFYLFDLG